MEAATEAMHWKAVYKILIGSIVPRPIGWISTVDPEGTANLAPFSFFNAVCGNPPTVLFCPMIRGTDGATKDTLNNLRTTPEFVVNIVTEGLAEAMNVTSTELPADMNEFEAAELTAGPSIRVSPPRVLESPIHMECEVREIIEIGDQIGGGSVVLGTVRQVHVDESVLLGEDKIDVEKLRPIGRLAGVHYCRTTDRFELVRPPSQIRP